MLSVVDQLLVGMLFLVFLPIPGLLSPPEGYLSLARRSILCMQQVTQRSAHLFASAVKSNFEPCTTFEPPKVSVRLANHIDYFGDDGRFV
jgi:hypothetical protein